MKTKRYKPVEYVKYVMEQMGWNQAEVSRICGISPSHISEYLNGKRDFTLHFIKKFLEASHRESMAGNMIWGVKKGLLKS